MLKQILYTAVVTPLKEESSNESSVDYKGLGKVLKSQEEAGNGVILLGSTGESLSLTTHERSAVVEFACQPENNIKGGMLIGVPGHNISEALDWLDFCNDMAEKHPNAIQGFLMTSPIYTKPGSLGQTKWFEALLNRAQKPAMLYNIPGRASMKLHPETVANLKDHQNFLAIKDSGGTIESILDYKTVAPDIAVYAGDDYMMAAMAAEGAVGLISVASNPWPKVTRKYVEACLKFNQANTEFNKGKIWWAAIKALFSDSNPVPVKALLKDIGMIESDFVRLPLSQGDFSKSKRQELLNIHNIISKF